MSNAVNIARRKFLKQGAALLATFAIPRNLESLTKNNQMTNKNTYDVIIVGGSYSGLAAGLALGRALRNVLIIDAEKPCNESSPHSHNFITNDGIAPDEIAMTAKTQVKKYETVEFVKDIAVKGLKINEGFKIETISGKSFLGKKLIFATGITDLMPNIQGYSECWGISAIHCPFCHGYEVQHVKTGVLENGESGFEFVSLISNWTEDLTLYTNGKSTLTEEQTRTLESNHIRIVENKIIKLEHKDGYMERIVFADSNKERITALYAKNLFIQHSQIPEQMGCILTDEGYIRTGNMQTTTIDGIFACGDNSSRMRTLANAVATGTTAGMIVNKELIEEKFLIKRKY
ncbi:MAG: FAD-dependent pyridine nucleotide-disulfide oxidoreductase [Bacteroidetes bacterium]|jgi:thioredoxin reductase|nr:FAD-dependent pyridine nucleotide-disulfide oxidoreductase [Bacteroidota bacterium]